MQYIMYLQLLFYTYSTYTSGIGIYQKVLLFTNIIFMGKCSCQSGGNCICEKCSCEKCSWGCCGK